MENNWKISCPWIKLCVQGVYSRSTIAITVQQIYIVFGALLGTGFELWQSHISLKNKNEYTIVDLIYQLIVDNVKKIQRKCQKYPFNASDHCIFIHFKRCCGGRYFCSLSVPCASANMFCMSVSHKTHVNSSVTQTSRHCVSLYLCTCVTRLTRWMR